MRVVKTSRSESLIGDARSIPQAEVRFKNFYEQAGFLRKRVNEFGGNMALREFVLRLIFPTCASRDEECMALTIGEWVQENITYVHEGRELFQSPETTMRLGAGDCDDMTTLICSCLQTVGIKNKMCLLKIGAPQNGARGMRWAHIFPVALVKVPGEPTLHRMTLDATLDEPIRDLVNPIAKVKERGALVKTLFV